jgi:uncharacterized membrane protein
MPALEVIYTFLGSILTLAETQYLAYLSYRVLNLQGKR